MKFVAASVLNSVGQFKYNRIIVGQKFVKPLKPAVKVSHAGFPLIQNGISQIKITAQPKHMSPLQKIGSHKKMQPK